jgi:UDP-glucuronate decarboxylase
VKWDTKVVEQDLENIAAQSPLPNAPKNYLITGGTGMFLKYLPKLLLEEVFSSKVSRHKLFLLVRDLDKARKEFYAILNNDNFHLVPLNRGWQTRITEPIDVLIHGAGSGSPNQVQSSRDDIMTPNVDLTKDLLDFAKYQRLSSFILLSSGIVYGSNAGVRTVSENDSSKEKHSAILENYQDAKTLAENIGTQYLLRFGVPVKIVRPAHCYGPTSDLLRDTRLACYLMKNALVDKKIHFTGSLLCMRSFVYISDAVSALFFIEKFGIPGEAYNLFSSRDFVSVQVFLEELLLKIIDIKISAQDTLNKREGLYMKPDKLESIGWSPKVKLKEGIERTIQHFSEELGIKI